MRASQSLRPLAASPPLLLLLLEGELEPDPEPPQPTMIAVMKSTISLFMEFSVTNLDDADMTPNAYWMDVVHVTPDNKST